MMVLIGETPSAFAARMYSWDFNCSIWPRTRRAMPHHPVRTSASIIVPMLLESVTTEIRITVSR